MMQAVAKHASRAGTGSILQHPAPSQQTNKIPQAQDPQVVVCWNNSMALFSALLCE
jgi:hypothetical protein